MIASCRTPGAVSATYARPHRQTGVRHDAIVPYAPAHAPRPRSTPCNHNTTNRDRLITSGPTIGSRRNAASAFRGVGAMVERVDVEGVEVDTDVRDIGTEGRGAEVSG